MDVYSLKNYLIANEDMIYNVLEKVGFTDISDNFNHGLEFRCAWEDGGNPTSVRVIKDNLRAQCFSKNINGDIITLVEAKLNCGFTKAVDVIGKVVNFNDVKKEEYEIPFDGFFKKVKKMQDNKYVEIETYDESILNDFEIVPNQMFLEDGIDSNIQLKYQIGYDVRTDRITVVWRGFGGKIVGLMGRLNRREVFDKENKWFPIIPFPKSRALFGFSENYRNIQSKSGVIISESEKSTMALESKGIGIGVSIGGSSLSQFQANNIKSLFPNIIIVALDEGLDEEVSVHMAEQLKMDSLYSNKVGYIYDKNNLILPKGSKLAPADLHKDDLSRLMKNHIKWI